MDDIEQAVGTWQRVYAELSGAREQLRRAEPTLSGRATAGVTALAAEVDRLLAEEERAMAAIQQAFAAAKHRLVTGRAAPARNRAEH